MISLADEYAIIQMCTSSESEIGPYIQTHQSDDASFFMEAVSNEFLSHPLGSQEIDALHELGWNDPQPGGCPNYNLFIDGSVVDYDEIAAFIVITLRDVYGVKTTDSFECDPYDLYLRLIHGEFGSPHGIKFSSQDLLDWQQRPNRQ